MLPSASALASRREERVQKAFSVDHHGPGDARLSHRATAIYGEHSDYTTRYVVLLVHVFSLEARRVGVLKQIMSAMRGHQSSYAAAVFTKKETNQGFCGVPCPVSRRVAVCGPQKLGVQFRGNGRFATRLRLNLPLLLSY